MLYHPFFMVLLGALVRADILVTPGTDSPWIIESGSDSGGTSHYVCPDDEVMIGRQHSGNADGLTQYECCFLYDQATMAQLVPYQNYASWGSWMPESGTDLDAESRFECPTAQAMIGREHSGNERGNTRYECAPFGFSNGTYYSTDPQEWSTWIQESGRDYGGNSSFVCPTDQLMVGRAHNGNENGDTQYRCAFAVIAPPPL